MRKTVSIKMETANIRKKMAAGYNGLTSCKELIIYSEDFGVCIEVDKISNLQNCG